MEKTIYVHTESDLTQQLLAWLSAPGPQSWTALSLGYNCQLDPQTSTALVNSPVMQAVTSLEFHEIRVSPEQLEELLTLPALETLILRGGQSQDWIGPVYIWETLKAEHIEVLLHNPNVRKLKALVLYEQRISSEVEARLRQALSQLEVLNIR